MSLIQVAAGVIRDRQGRVLLSKRPEDAHQGGLWEFPGGKIKHRETPVQALARELREELGIDVYGAEPLIEVQHSYPNLNVRLHVFNILGFNGHPSGLENQPLKWVAPGQLDQLAMPAADRPIINAIRLPDRYAISGRFANPEDFLHHLKELLDQGLDMIQLRAKDLTLTDLRDLAEAGHQLCAEYNAKLLLNGPPGLVRELGLAGVHMTANALMSFQERPLSSRYWVAASCHNERELSHAESLGVDFVCLSPVLPTASHPDAEPLGIARFRELCQATNLPVYALGGMSRDDLARIRRAGAQGIAGISAFWSLD